MKRSEIEKWPRVAEYLKARWLKRKEEFGVDAYENDNREIFFLEVRGGRNRYMKMPEPMRPDDPTEIVESDDWLIADDA